MTVHKIPRKIHIGHRSVDPLALLAQWMENQAERDRQDADARRREDERLQAAQKTWNALTEQFAAALPALINYFSARYGSIGLSGEGSEAPATFINAFDIESGRLVDSLTASQVKKILPHLNADQTASLLRVREGVTPVAPASHDAECGRIIASLAPSQVEKILPQLGAEQAAALSQLHKVVCDVDQANAKEAQKVVPIKSNGPSVRPNGPPGTPTPTA